MGFLEDYTGHEHCKRKSPPYVDIYAPKSKKTLGSLSGFSETTHCPDDDKPIYYPFGDHWAVSRS